MSPIYWPAAVSSGYGTICSDGDDEDGGDGDDDDDDDDDDDGGDGNLLASLVWVQSFLSK